MEIIPVTALTRQRNVTNTSGGFGNVKHANTSMSILMVRFIMTELANTASCSIQIPLGAGTVTQVNVQTSNTQGYWIPVTTIIPASTDYNLVDGGGAVDVVAELLEYKA